MSDCCLCNSPRLETLLRVEAQPLGNRFLSAVDADEYTHPKHAAVCLDCGLVQLVDPVPAAEMMPLFDWITYNEPEPHLDRTAEILFGLPGISPESVVGGVSFKDDSTIARLQGMGVTDTWRIDPREHLGVDRPGVGVETVQDRLPRCLDAGLAQFAQSADILISRHILEHCHDLRGYLRGLRAMIRPGGYLFLEVPCCDDQFRLKDYAPLWEEHLQYYTPAIFKELFSAFGFELVHYERVAYPLEDSLVGIGRLKGGERPLSLDAAVLDAEIERARGYGRGVRGHAHMVGGLPGRVHPRAGQGGGLRGRAPGVHIRQPLGIERIYFLFRGRQSGQGRAVHARFPAAHPGLVGPGGRGRQAGAHVLQPGGGAQGRRQQPGLCRAGRAVRVHLSQVLHRPGSGRGGGMTWKKINDEVYYLERPGLPVGDADLDELVRLAAANPRGRARLCTHEGPDALLQEMFIVHDRSCYVRPHKHLDKEECVTIHRGEVDVVLFDEDGNVGRRAPARLPGHGQAFFLPHGARRVPHVSYPVRGVGLLRGRHRAV